MYDDIPMQLVVNGLTANWCELFLVADRGINNVHANIFHFYQQYMQQVGYCWHDMHDNIIQHTATR